MRVVATTPLPVHQRIDEGLGTCFGHRSAQLLIGRVRPAVQQVVADRAMQERGILGDHADLLAQAFLRDVGNVLVVDQDAAAFQVVQAQQYVDQGRLAGTGRTHQADLLARLHHQVEACDHAALLAVVEVDALEVHATAGHLQRHRVLAVLHGQRLGNGGDAILYRTDVLEDAVDGPHDPAGHVVDADHQAGRERDRADSDVAAIPQPQGQATGTGNQETVDDGDGQVHAGGHPGLRAVLDCQLLDRLGHVGLLAPAMGEQFQRGNVGVAIAFERASEAIQARSFARGTK